MARAHLGARAGGPVILYVHGGGFILNSLDTHDVLCRAMALRTRCRVVAVDYRRPPDAPFEAMCEDVAAAYRHCVALAGEGAAAGAQPRVAVAGDSAGGHLAVSLALQLIAARAEAAGGGGEGAPPFPSVSAVLPNDDVRALAALPLPALVVPLYGAFDLTGATTESREIYAEGWVLSEKFVGHFEKHLSHGRSAEATSALRALPFVSPLRAPRAFLARMPRMLIIAAEHDMLRDDSANMLAALRGAGGAHAELLVAPGQVHGFSQFPRELAVGRRFMEAEVYPRIREALLAEGAGGGEAGAGAGAGAGAQPEKFAAAEESTVI